MSLLLILLALVLVFLNGFFVAAEFAMVKLRQTRIPIIKEQYGRRGKILANVHSHLDTYLSACQLGITLASLGLGWVGEPAFAHVLEPVFTWVGIASVETMTAISFLCAFLIISFLHIVLGELVPKSLAIRQSEKISIWTATPLYMFYWIMFPAIWLLNKCANFFLKICGLGASHHGEHFHSTEEIKLILNSSHLHGELTQHETEIIEHTMDLADLRVTNVMRPCDEMVMLDIETKPSDLLQTVLEHRFSRYPIYDKSKQEIIGIVHVKDLFAVLYKQREIPTLATLIRPVLKVSHRFPAIELLHKFREGMPHFALIYNGNTLLGFVTLDNLLHVLIGRIKDEFHKTKDDWIANPDGSITVEGDCSIYALEQVLEERLKKNIDLTTMENIDTVSDLILHQLGLGAMPKQGQQIEFKDFVTTIETTQGQQIQQVTIHIKKIE